MDKNLKLKCRPGILIDIAEIEIVQGNLKEQTKKQFEALKKEMLEGITFCVDVAKVYPKQPWQVVDGTHRVHVFRHLFSHGWTMPFGDHRIPCHETFCDNQEDLKQRILQRNSKYARITKDGLYKFSASVALTIDEMRERFDIGINWEEFKSEFTDEGKIKAPKEKCPTCGKWVDGDKL